MLGPHGLSNPPVVSSTSTHLAGTVQEPGGLKIYQTGSPDSKLAIILVHDAFGFEAPNLWKLADKVAAEGYLVVVPDFFNGEPFQLNNPQFDRELWMKAHGPDKGCEAAKILVAALKNKGVSAIGAAGFCWGGMVVLRLAISKDIQAAVLLHPGPITKDEINEVRVPIAILGAEIDQFCPSEQLKQFGEMLSSNSEIDSFVKIFAGMTHGWAIRYNAEDESAVKAAEEAHEDMLNWLTKYVK